MLHFLEKAKLRQVQLWFLVVLNFLGALYLFLQNIYFFIYSDVDCKLFTVIKFFLILLKFKNDPSLNNYLNGFSDLIIKICTLFWPYCLTIKIFWFSNNEPQVKNSLKFLSSQTKKKNLRFTLTTLATLKIAIRAFNQKLNKEMRASSYLLDQFDD
jgi:hypothetical protein